MFTLLEKEMLYRCIDKTRYTVDSQVNMNLKMIQDSLQ